MEEVKKLVEKDSKEKIKEKKKVKERIKIPKTIMIITICIILEDSSKDRKIFNKISVPFTESRIIFSLDVEVTAGLNFKEIEQDISEDGKTVTITLPKAKIYKYYQVPNTFNSYLDDESWFTNINSKERHDLEDAVVEKGKEKALEAGLLEKADKNAKTIIEQMVKAKDKDIDIIWKEK